MPTPDFSKIWASNSPLPEFVFTDEEYTEGWDFVGSAPPTKNQFDAWFRYVDERLRWLYDEMQATASKLYPVGSVYISFNSTSPSTLFGGTWVRLKDTFLLVNGDTYPANSTGGSATKTIAMSNMPSHNHSVSSSGLHTHPSGNVSVSSAGSHDHTRGTMEITGQIKSTDTTEPLTFSDDITSSGALSAGGKHTWANGGVGTITGGSYEQINFKASSGWSGATSSNGAHIHTVNISLSGGHTHTTNNTGDGTPLNIMPPYTTVYAWRRTA